MKAIGSSPSGDFCFPYHFFSCFLSFSVYSISWFIFCNMYMHWIYHIKQNIPILWSLWSSFTRKIYVKTDFIFKSLYDTYAKHWVEITLSLLRFWKFFIGSWIQLGVKGMCIPWQNGRMSETNSWRRFCSQNPLHAYSTPSKLLAILCILLGNPLQVAFSKLNIFFFSETTQFPLYTQRASRVPPWVLAVRAKTLWGQ